MVDIHIDPRYEFRFSINGGPIETVAHYWKGLYALSYRNTTLLVSSRIVPNSDPLFAVYLYLKQQTSGKETPVPETETARELVKIGLGKEITDLIPVGNQLPQYVKDATKALATYSAGDAVREMFDSDHAMTSEPNVELNMEGDKLPAPDMEAMIAGVSDEDLGWVMTSSQVFNQFLSKLNKTQIALERHHSDESALMLRKNVYEEASRMLLSDPEYVAMVKRVMSVKGGYASPAVQHFVRFYYRYLAGRIVDAQLQTLFVPEILDEVLGLAEAESQHSSPHYLFTVLGRLLDGDVRPSKGDPELMSEGFQVSRDTRPADLILEPVAEGVSRQMMKMYLRYRLGDRHFVKDIDFFDVQNQA